jgi:Domain of unknown function (DUF4397)
MDDSAHRSDSADHPNVRSQRLHVADSSARVASTVRISRQETPVSLPRLHVTKGRHRRSNGIGRAIRAAAATLAVSVVVIGVSTTPVHAEAAVGYVRLAHLSPDTPKVDVYLSKVGDSSFATQVFEHVGYGVMSNYLALPVGTYAIAMRTEGAPASSPPVLTTQVTVTEGAAYTVAGVGKFSGLGLKVFTDDLTRPTDGMAKVRVIQASVKAPILDVDLNDGTPVAKAVSFASTTNYQVVNPGPWTLRLRPNGSSSTTTLGVELAGGSVYSLLVLDGPSGLALELRADARGGATAPDGSVEAGAGGDSLWLTMTVIALAALLVAAFVVVALRLRRLRQLTALRRS